VAVRNSPDAYPQGQKIGVHHRAISRLHRCRGLTGIMLGIARVAGESAPLLFTALFSNFWLSSLFEPTASLSILIYNFSSMPFPNQLELAWAASLVLVLIVLALNILSRLVGRPKV
jgi:phosphate transport system permease protein